MTTEKKGNATLFVRLQSRKHGINYKVASALEVDILAWNKSKKSSTTLNNFREANPDLTLKMIPSNGIWMLPSSAILPSLRKR